MVGRLRATEATDMLSEGDATQEGSDIETKGKTRPSKGATTAVQSPNLFYLSGYNGMSLVEPVLLELGWKQTQDKSNDLCKFRWTECITQGGFSTFKEGEQLINHIPNCGMITNKLGLLMSLRDYQRRCVTLRNRAPALNMSDFYPETYIIDDKNERESLFNSHTEGDIWINKPTGSNQGKGIFLVRDMVEFKQQLVVRDAESRANPRGIKARIVQRYMQNPLLLDGRKFDIRCFMYIASTVPFLVCFHPGYIRLSIQQYSNEDTNLTTHLTNQFMQKKDPNYQSMKNDTVWSMEKFSDYIQEHYSEAHNLGDDWVKNVLNKQMQKIIMHLFQAVKTKIAARVGLFELYGLDFMVDDNFKIWLIEVNVNPAMHTNCEILKQVLPPIIEEVIHMSLECFEKSRKGKALTPLASQKNFQTLYNEGSSANWSRSSTQNSLRYWVAPRFRSISESPTRHEEQHDSQGQATSQSTNNSNNQRPPFILSNSVPKFSVLPRVATLQPKTFENTLRGYRKIEFGANKKEALKPDQSAVTVFSERDKRQQSPNKGDASGEKVEKSADGEKKPNGNSPEKSQTNNNSAHLVNEQKKVASTVRPSPTVTLPKYRQRPTPVPREPAPVTRVQVLTGKAPDNSTAVNPTMNRYSQPSPKLNKSNNDNLKLRKSGTPLDRSS